ncbi:hypothetical protein [Nocardioides sp. YIM 152315]|uniref:VG15 protein n=1 Tax=Nocardioides sp. YIM 152315 TaxID=3031760 RepID=UPI0023DBB9C2|nr:hypothetical protein [Nocardioides sp. YIM 152315]MDF1603389.1 hypothetical protein [Nocardioides sp. YIM 152315]
MATPSLSQARSHYDRQRKIVGAAVLAVRSLFRRRRPMAEVVNTVAAYQFASATAAVRSVAAMAEDRAPLTNPRAFMGVSSLGFPISEPIVAAIDQIVPAPVEPLPDTWWEDAAAFVAEVEQLIASEVADAYRTASQVEFVVRPTWQNYVRMLNPPSCPRCAILAGRIYRDLEAFRRHPGCDCVMIPVQDWESAHDAGYVSSFQQAFERGDVRGLSKADAQAITDGADPARVVNATRGTSTPGITTAYRTEVFGRRVKATHDAATKRSAWRKANPTRLVRLRPESIYEFAEDHDDAIRLLRLYGYLTS